MLLIEYVGHIGLRSLTDGHLGRHLEYFKTLNDARVASVGFIKYNASTTRINKEKNFKIKFQVNLVFYRTYSTITNCRQPRGTVRKSRSTITRHQEDKLSKAISSLFPIKMIAIPKWTQSNVQQNIEQLQTPTMGVTINRKSTTTEPPP